jgi:hypothetical protein
LKIVIFINLVPRILVIHLKRFDNFQRKIKKFIKYENEINLNKFLFENKEENYRYRLFSVLVHDGFSINSGHYYSYVKNSNDIWYCMNDSHVSRVNEKEIFQQSPYILFYERIIDMKLSLVKEIKLEKKIEENISSLDTSSSDGFVKIEEKKVNVLVGPVEKLEVKAETLIKLVQIKEIAKENISVRPAEKVEVKENIIAKHSEVRQINKFEDSKIISIDDIPILKGFMSRKRKNLRRIFKNIRKSRKLIIAKQKNKKQAKLQKTIIKPIPEVKQEIIMPKAKSTLQPKPIDQPQIISYNRKPNELKIYNPNLKDLYGSDKVEMWDSDTEADSDLLKKQINFMKCTSEFKTVSIQTKTEYDKEYDQGKTKKIKLKKQEFNNSFTKMVNKKLIYQK